MRPATLAEAAERMRQGQATARVLSEFLDSFYLAPTASERSRILWAEPVLTGRGVDDAFIGGIAEYLAKQHDLPAVPGWASGPARYLAEPWFATGSDDPALREYLTFASPAEFKSRNLFVEERPLRRARTPRR